MNQILNRLRAASAYIWIKLVQYLNRIALGAGALILSLNEMYPNAVSDFSASLPPMVKLILLVLWSGVVEGALHRAAKKA